MGRHIMQKGKPSWLDLGASSVIASPIQLAAVLARPILNKGRARRFVGTGAFPAFFLLVKCSSFGPWWPKLSFREVVYMLVPRYYPLGDYYESIYNEGQVVKPYIFVEICI